jgi:hypothetical protein
MALRFNRVFFVIALSAFGLELLVATVFAGIPFIRGSMSDFLVVIFIHVAILTVYPVSPTPLAIGVFLFAALIEIGQHFHFADALGLTRGSLLSILLGNTFSWNDMLMYALGALAAWSIQRNVERLNGL